jgi:hypothetical protein
VSEVWLSQGEDEKRTGVFWGGGGGRQTRN